MGKNNLHQDEKLKNAKSQDTNLQNFKSISLENSDGYFGQDMSKGSIPSVSATNGGEQKADKPQAIKNPKKQIQSPQQKTDKSQAKEKSQKQKKKVTFIGFLWKTFAGLVGAVLTFAITMLLVFYFKYNVNIIETGIQINKLHESVDTSKFDNQFSSSDYNSYENKMKNFNSEFSAILFSDKEIASFINYSIEQTKKNENSSEKKDLSDTTASASNFDLVKELDLKLIQLDLYNTFNSNSPNHLTDLNFVVSLSSTKIKEKYLQGMLSSKFAGFIPETIYVSGTVEILKNNEENADYDYKVVYKSVKLNNLTEESSEKLIDSINNFVKIGTAKEFTENFGKTFANAMIGNSTTTGLYSAISEYGGKGYSFYTKDNVDYLIIYSHKTTDSATITYNNLKTAENTNPTTYTVLDNDIVFKDISANGYEFLGFYTDEIGGSKLTGFNTWALKDITVYARWNIISYDIDYVMRGGKTKEENPISYTIEDEFTLFDAYKVAETPFLGWTGTIVENATKNLKVEKGTYGNLVFYAWFDDDERELSLYGDSKKLASMVIVIGMPIEKDKVEEIFDLTKLGLAGYSSSVWCIDETLSEVYDFDTLVYDDVNLYTSLEYMVKQLTFYSYIQKFEQAVTSKNLEVNSREELTAYLEYVLFYDVTTEVSIKLAYAETSKVAEDEFAESRNIVKSISNTFQTASTISFVHPYSVNYVKYYVSNSTLSTDATLTIDEDSSNTKKSYKFALGVQNSNKRASDFDDFKIDNVSKTLKVSTSTQLVYCLEQGFRPDCVAGSNAERMYNRAKEVLREICNDDMSDETKLRAIFEWLIYNVNYDTKAYEKSFEISAIETRKYNSWYVEGVFDTGVAVCEAYAKAFLMMSKIEGIPAIFVTGNEHAWNRVYLNGKWYGVDATHGDATISKNEVTDYEQFLFSDSYKTSIGYTSNDYAEFVASAEYNYYSNEKYNDDGNEFDLYINSTAEMSLLCAYLKKRVESDGLTFYSFDFEASADVSDIKIISIIKLALGVNDIKYSYKQKNALTDHYIFMVG